MNLDGFVTLYRRQNQVSQEKYKKRQHFQGGLTNSYENKGNEKQGESSQQVLKIRKTAAKSKEARGKTTSWTVTVEGYQNV